MQKHLRNKHITRFGYPFTQGGALYDVADEKGLCQMAIDLEIARLVRSGFTIDQQTISEITKGIKQKSEIYNKKVSEQGIPNNFLTLLSINKKSEVDKYCKDLLITEFDLFLLIHNCYQINLVHSAKFIEYVPDHLEITTDDKQSLYNGNATSVSKKLNPLLRERRVIHAHLLYRGYEWHCFYFSYEDIEIEEKNHWEFGSHLHYISYLWSNFTKKQVWHAFDRRTTKLSGNQHIRFLPYDYPETGDVDTSLLSNLDNSPGGFAFDPLLAENHGDFPAPMPHITTRGCWIINVKE
jgi:hypothetical protein